MHTFQLQRSFSGTLSGCSQIFTQISIFNLFNIFSSNSQIFCQLRFSILSFDELVERNRCGRSCMGLAISDRGGLLRWVNSDGHFSIIVLILLSLVARFIFGSLDRILWHWIGCILDSLGEKLWILDRCFVAEDAQLVDTICNHRSLMQINLFIEDTTILVSRWRRDDLEGFGWHGLRWLRLLDSFDFILSISDSALVPRWIPWLGVDFRLQALLDHLLHFHPLCLLFSSSSRFFGILVLLGLSVELRRRTMRANHGLLLHSSKILCHLHGAIILLVVSLEVWDSLRLRW